MRISVLAMMLFGLMQSGMGATAILALRAQAHGRPILTTGGDMIVMLLIVGVGAIVTVNAMFGAEEAGRRRDLARAEAARRKALTAAVTTGAMSPNEARAAEHGVVNLADHRKDHK